MIHATVPCFKYRSSDFNGHLLTEHCATNDWTLEALSLQRPVVSSKVPETTFHDRTRLVMLDWTQPASGHTVLPLYALRQRTSALTGRTLPVSGR